MYTVTKYFKCIYSDNDFSFHAGVLQSNTTILSSLVHTFIISYIILFKKILQTIKLFWLKLVFDWFY